MTGAYLDATQDVLKKHRGLWFNDESFVVHAGARSSRWPTTSSRNTSRRSRALLDRDHAADAGSSAAISRGAAARHRGLRRAPPDATIDDVAEVACAAELAGFRGCPHVVARASSRARARARRSRAASGRHLARAAGGRRQHAARGRLRQQPRSAADRRVRRSTASDDRRCRPPRRQPEQSARTRRGGARAQEAECAEDRRFDVYFATQFGFDPAAFTDWDAELRREGITLPMHVGIPGPASLKPLAKFAMHLRRRRVACVCSRTRAARSAGL